MLLTRLSSVTTGAVLAAALLLPSPGTVLAEDGKFSARLRGFREVPSISTTGTGSFRATLSPDGLTVTYTLTHSDLTAPVTQSHIHFGETHTNGAIMVFLCQTVSNPDPTGLAPTCVNSGSVEGSITAANIIQAGTQGIVAGEYDEFLLALQGGAGYVNVHTTAFGSGEIRGQVSQ